jgi:hypothetical protein
VLTVKKWVAWAAVGAIAGAWFSYALWSTTPFQNCLGTQEEKYKATQEAKDNPPKSSLPFIVNARNDTVCGFAILYDYRDAITVLATALIAFFTWTLYRATDRLWDAATEQGNDMKNSIAEANRSANAMERSGHIAQGTLEHARVRSAQQMRAYVSVDIGTATYQDTKLRFASGPTITNTGYTPARNVSYQVMAEILDADLPPDHVFEKFAEKRVNDASLAPRQQFTVHGLVRDRVPDADVEAVMRGENRRLFVWGTVSYDDVFGGSWETNFCHNFIFYKAADGNIKFNGFLWRTHNNAT